MYNNTNKVWLSLIINQVKLISCIIIVFVLRESFVFRCQKE